MRDELANFSMLFAASLLIAFTTFASWTEARLLETSVSCDQNNFILSLNFDLPFQGIVYTEEGFPNCVYVNGTLLSHISYQLKIPLIGCETKMNMEGNYENAIIVQENAAFLQGSDKKYLLTCIPVKKPSANSNEREMTLEFGGVTVQNNRSADGIVRGTFPDSSAASEPRYSVEVRSGHSLDAPSISNALNIGDPISYVVKLQKPVAESQIGRCWANDEKTSLELSDDRGCSLQPRGSIWGSFERVETIDEVAFINRIKAWAFPTSNEVNIFCNLRVCMSRNCELSSCSSLDDDLHRQKKLGRMRRHRANSSETFFEDLVELKTHFRFQRKSENGRQKAPQQLESMLIDHNADERSVVTAAAAEFGSDENPRKKQQTKNGFLCVSTGQLLLLTVFVFIFLICTIAIFVFIVCIRQRRIARTDSRLVSGH